MRDLRVLARSHRPRDSDAVVRSERRVQGHQPVAVPDDVDPPRSRIVRTARIPFAHHVQVCLEDDRRSLVATRGRGNADDNVAGFIDDGVESALGAPGEHVRPRLFLLLRGPRDARQREEVAPDEPGLDVRDLVLGQRRSVSAAPATRRVMPTIRGHVVATRSTPNQP